MPAMRLLGVVVLALIAFGCRAVHWSRPGATEQDFYQAKRACEASLGPSVCWGAGCIDQEVIRSRQWQDCMRAEGWVSSTTRGFDTSGHTFSPTAGTAPASAPLPTEALIWRLWITHPETGAPVRAVDDQHFSSLTECLGYLDAAREVFRSSCPPANPDPRCSTGRLGFALTRCLQQ